MNILDRIRTFNKHVINPVTLKIGGLVHSPISVVHHVGHRSGKPYKTPVIVARLDGRFVFALTYGANVDWYRNIRSAGHCTLRWHGDTYALERPKPIEAAIARPAFALPLRLILRVINTRRFFTMVISENRPPAHPHK